MNERGAGIYPRRQGMKNSRRLLCSDSWERADAASAGAIDSVPALGRAMARSNAPLAGRDPAGAEFKDSPE